MLLAGQVFELSNSCKLEIIWIIYGTDFLILCLIREMLVLKPERSIGQFSITEPKIFIDLPGVENRLRNNMRPYVLEVHAKFNANVGVIKHAGEHRAVSFGRHLLEGVCEVAIVIVGANRNAAGHLRTKLREI